MSGERHQDTWERRDEAEQKVEELEQENAELRERVESMEEVVDVARHVLSFAPTGPPETAFESLLCDLHVAIQLLEGTTKQENQEESRRRVEKPDVES